MEKYQMPTRSKYRETDVLNCDTELTFTSSPDKLFQCSTISSVKNIHVERKLRDDNCLRILKGLLRRGMSSMNKKISEIYSYQAFEHFKEKYETIAQPSSGETKETKLLQTISVGQRANVTKSSGEAPLYFFNVFR